MQIENLELHVSHLQKENDMLKADQINLVHKSGVATLEKEVHALELEKKDFQLQINRM